MSTTNNNPSETDGEQYEIEYQHIGSRMQRVIEYVAKYGTCSSKMEVAEATGPNGSTQYGYPPVERCIARDLLKVDTDHEKASPYGKGAVCITDKGKTYLRNKER